MKMHVWKVSMKTAVQQLKKLGGNKHWLAGVMLTQHAATYLQARGSPAPPG